MRTRLKSVLAGIGAAVGLVLVAPAGAAHAIDEVPCRGDDLVQLDIRLNPDIGTNKCFANAGVKGVDVSSVYYVKAGKYKVTINYEQDGRYHSKTFNPRMGLGFGNPVRVYEVRIW
ncbi:beta/gamma crystallin domain-containing protein [Prauserella cavernicola]|uniref:Streptomyces killer toxin-like beta/gamma crystallin domain-containing protein n=1 Tax=Prauserella cavernicola TaxID=2800127 RepID=A0A934QWA7_9PSEU|nr:beta/gamma crystallin domain-containing protein [Prauserella cavernicola]MBK1789457.1 hypothetical protein [Prauserella cavernicola]